MTAPILDLSNVISVSVLPTPSGLGVPNVNTACIFTRDTKPSGWGGSQTYAVYKTAYDVKTDFGLTSNSYAMATAFFSQNPNPLLTNGYLVIVPLLTSPSAEKVIDAISRTKDLVYYFGILIDEEMGSAESDFVALTAAIEALDKMFFYTSSSISDLESGSMLDDVRTAGKVKCRMFYHGNPLLNGASVQQTQIFSASYAGRALSTDFSGSLTASTMHLKKLTGINADTTIGQTQLTKAIAAGIDVYVNIAGASELFTSGGNDYFDNVYNLLWLKFALQVAGFNYLAGTNYKIPQTETGMTGLKDAYRKIMEQAKSNGVLAGGSWTSPDTFGDPIALRRNISDLGYYVYSMPIVQQSSADRTARKAPIVQIAAKLAGAIHSSNVVVNVNS